MGPIFSFGEDSREGGDEDLTLFYVLGSRGANARLGVAKRVAAQT